MTRIFISYSRTDELFARQLATALSNLNADIWIDIEDIPAGMKWSSAIQQGLDSAEALIVVISPEAMASRNVEDEWQYFLDHDKPVIPVFLRNAKIHFQLNRIQWVDFKNQSFDIALVDLHEELKRNGIHLAQPARPTHDLPPVSHGHASPPSPETETISQPTPQSGGNNMLLYGIGAVGLLIVLIVAGIMFASSNGNDAQATAQAQDTQIAQLQQMTATFDNAFAQQTQNAVIEATNAVVQTENAVVQATNTALQIANETATARAIPTQTPTTVPIDLGPITDNDEWEPIEALFDGVTMVLVPTGRFQQGATQQQFEANFATCREKLNENSCNALRDELNTQEVTMRDAYWIDKYEVSQQQYRSSGSDLPQVNITSQEAQAHCATRDASLPSESEWEYAAKGVSNWRYPWGNMWELNEVRANFCDVNCTQSWRETRYDDGYAEASPVTAIHGSESWVGAFNLVGNVWEWTSDPYPDGATNTLRGGAWTWIQGETTTTSRAAGIAEKTDFYGFRCVRPYQEGDIGS